MVNGLTELSDTQIVDTRGGRAPKTDIDRHKKYDMLDSTQAMYLK